MKGVGALAAGLCIVLAASLSFAGEKASLKFAHNYPLGHPHYEGAELFKKLVGGEIRFPAEITK